MRSFDACSIYRFNLLVRLFILDGIRSGGNNDVPWQPATRNQPVLQPLRSWDHTAPAQKKNILHEHVENPEATLSHYRAAKSNLEYRTQRALSSPRGTIVFQALDFFQSERVKVANTEQDGIFRKSLVECLPKI